MVNTLSLSTETQVSTIEAAFQEYTERKDIAILLINQHASPRYASCLQIVANKILTQVAEKIRPTVDKYQQAFPALLEIPSKDHPYGMSRFLYATYQVLISVWIRSFQGLSPETRSEAFR